MIIVHCGYQERGRRIKLTSDRDCLPADISHYGQRVLPDIEAVKACVATLECAGFAVCADFEDWFYETATA